MIAVEHGSLAMLEQELRPWYALPRAHGAWVQWYLGYPDQALTDESRRHLP